MEKKLSDIIQEYDDCKNKFQEFGESVYQLIKSLLSHYEIKPHQLSYRLKERDSLEKKLVKKNYKYKSISELTDVVGLRIITYFEDDIDRIAQLIEKEFEIDKKNSIDKRQLETDKFGYRSLHFVFGIKQNRLKLTEYTKFIDLKAEIQIRSILQHSWAEIEHDLGYKGESEIPKSAKRTFYRVAALLEQADIEFVKLRAEIKQHESIIKEKIQVDPSSVQIDKTSLISFISESSILKEFEAKVHIQTITQRDDSNDSIVINLVPRLIKLKITTIKDLEDLYSKNETKMLEFINDIISRMKELKQTPYKAFAAGASLLWLCSVLENKK